MEIHPPPSLHALGAARTVPPGAAEPRDHPASKTVWSKKTWSKKTWLVAVPAAAALTLALLGAGWAWSHYGPTIFFEMIAAGLAACF